MSTTRRIAALLLCMGLLGWTGGLAKQAKVPIDEALQEEIELLAMSVWDQKMARQFDMGLEMPVSEVQARFDILQRWAAAIDAADAEFPGGFAAKMKELSQLLEGAETDTDLDPVLLFLEESLEPLAAASGLVLTPPDAAGRS